MNEYVLIVPDESPAMETEKRFCIFVFDRPSFQNAALSGFLHRTTRRACRVVEHIPPAADMQGALLLVNAHATHPLDALRALERAGVPAAARVCLFNVAPADCPVEVVDFPFLKGIFTTDTTHLQLVRGIEAVFAGDAWLPRRLLVAHMESTRRRPRESGRPIPLLTDKEMAILERIAAGSANGTIAQAMGVSIHTVKTHVYNLFRKLDVSNRTQATNWANRHLGDIRTSAPQKKRSVRVVEPGGVRPDRTAPVDLNNSSEKVSSKVGGPARAIYALPLEGVASGQEFGTGI